MTRDKKAKSTTVYRPADITVYDENCVPDGLGTNADLSATISILITNDEDIEAVAMLVNGSLAAGIPTEQLGSPTTPSPGMKLHTYDWTESVMCDEAYSLKAIAEIVLRTTPPSNTVSVYCPCE